jgi:hypothetical protein
MVPTLRPLAIGHWRRRALKRQLDTYHAEIKQLSTRTTLAEEVIASTQATLAEIRRMTDVGDVAPTKE